MLLHHEISFYCAIERESATISPMHCAFIRTLASHWIEPMKERKMNSMKSDVPSKQLDARKKKAAQIVAALKKLYPEAKTVLRHSNPWELYVAVVLSAQTTDKKVNEIPDRLFKRYKTLDDYVNANPEEFEQEIRGVNYHRNKAKSIL